MTHIAIAAAAAVLLLAEVFAGAAERNTPLPAFTVVAADGRRVPSSALSEESQWLLVYVTPGCAPCDRLMKALVEWRSPQLDARTIVLVQGTPGEVKTYMETLGLAPGGPAWFADPPRQAHAALKLAGAPALVAIKDGRIAWTIEGVLNDPSAVESVIRAWLADR